MKHIISYDTHSEKKFENWLTTQFNKVRSLIRGHVFMEDYLKKEFKKKLDHYDLTLVQESKSNINFFHDERLVGYIRPRRTPRTYYLVIFVYLDELIAPKSEYERYPGTNVSTQDTSVTEIIKSQKNDAPFGTTEVKISMSKSELIGSFIKWWGDWSNSGREADENP
jgi:hypothetical protein